MDRDSLETSSQITFLYYRELEPADVFYRETMGFDLVEDQGWAKIYQVSEQAFLGTVLGEKGFHRPREANAVTLTFVVNDVQGWYDHLSEAGVVMLTEVSDSTEIGVRGFFAQDPGGYTIEIQRFLNPETQRVFG